MSDAATQRGSCHCGKLGVLFRPAQPVDTLHPRACDCAFCTKHGATWVSDPAGTLAIVATAPPRECRQGSGNARFLLCGDCGVLAAVVHESDGRLRGAVNVRCMDDADAFGAAIAVSPRQLPPEGRVARWQQVWTPAGITIRQA